MKNEKGTYVKLGLFVIAGSIIMMVGAYMLGNQQNMFSKTFEITTRFKNVNGLQEGNNVRFSGIQVGTVSEIVMENDTSVRVHMIIEESIRQHLRKNAVAMVGSDGLVGSMLINIVPGKGSAAAIAEGDTIESYSRITTQDMLTTLNVTNENAALLTSDLLTITGNLKNGSGVLGHLMNDSLMAKDLREGLHNLNAASRQAVQTLNRMNRMLADMNFEESTASLILSDTLFRKQIEDIAASLDSSSRDIRQLSGELKILAANINEGEGTLGMILKDSLVADQFRHTLKYLDSGMVKFDQNMEALQHNFLTRRYFRKLARKEARERNKQ